MSWKNYEKNIVDEYRVSLYGWPENVAFDPATLGFKALDRVAKVLESGECSWLALTDEQYKERKEIRAETEPMLLDRTNQRKERTDKGKKRGAYKKKKRARAASTDNGSSDSNVE